MVISATETSQKNLLIRADASSEMGTGHIMRCLALAHAWQDDGGEAHFACAEIPATLESRLSMENCTLHKISAKHGTSEDAKATRHVTDTIHARWTVLDGYCFDRPFQHELRTGGRKVLVVDDNGETGPWDCDAILNQNVHADRVPYDDRPDSCTLLLGSEYTLLRRELRQAAHAHLPVTDQAQGLRLLVMAGGADPDNVTAQILSMLADEINIAEARVICGSANPHLSALTESARILPFPCEIVFDAPDMTPHFQWANSAITAAGSSCWELCAFKIPFLPIAIADNQRHIAEFFRGIFWEGAKSGSAICNWIQKQKESSPLKKCLVNIDGAESVCRHLASSSLAADCFEVGTERFHLRKAEAKDVKLLFDWANDPVVRKQSFNSEPIPWDKHCEWYLSGNENRMIYICESSACEPVGSMRFEKVSDESSIANIQIDPAWRGKGLAAPLISTASRFYRASSGDGHIVAKIKADNVASCRAFENAGYSLLETSASQRTFRYPSA